MAEGLSRERWSHTSVLCAMIANAHRDPKSSRPFKPADFDPTRSSTSSKSSSPQVADKASLSFLREALEARKGRT